jgi:uncharacterized protein (DUF1778 family)
MREKGMKGRKTGIMIRVNSDEKAMANRISHLEGKNMSQFFRDYLHEYHGNHQLNLLIKLTDESRRLLKEYKNVLGRATKKGKN